MNADLSGAVVKLYRRDVGRNADTLVGQATVTHSLMTGNRFSAKLPRLRRNCVVTAVWDGDDGYFGSRTWMFAGVTPRLTVTAPLATQKETKLRVDIAPVQPSHRTGMTRPEFLAGIQCRVAGVWTSFPGELGVEGTDGESWCVYRYFDVPAGTYTIRANFKGTNYNAASVSRPVQIVVPEYRASGDRRLRAVVPAVPALPHRRREPLRWLQERDAHGRRLPLHHLRGEAQGYRVLLGV